MASQVRAVAVLAAVVTVSVLAGPVAAGAPPALDWRPCPDNQQVECAALRVPVDWAAPEGPGIEMAVARLRATDPANRRGVLVYAPAGPGSSGVDALTVDQIRNLVFSPAAAAHFDLVSFDPRGVRRSSPVLCDSALSQRVAEPTTRQEFQTRRTENAALAADCRDRTGPVFDHLDSNDMARDVDALRAALGEPVINLYGLSYGTVLGQMYAELFPGRIRAMVFDANVDHSLSTERFTVRSARAAQGSFDELVAWCARAAACVLHGRDVRAIVAELFAKARKGELVDPADPTRTIGEPELRSAIVTPLSIPRRNDSARRIAQLAGLAPVSPAPPADPWAGSDAIPLPIAIFCADHRFGIRSFDRLRHVRERAAGAAPDLGGGAYGVPILCLNWSPATNPAHRLRVRGAPPIVVLNSRHDPSTPLESAAAVASQIDGARLVVYDGAGHGAWRRGDCTTGVVDRYFVDLTVPRNGTRCPAVDTEP